MNLHNEIMNIPTGQLQEMAAVEERNRILVYRMGHRDARHSAAELSLKFESYIHYLEEIVLSTMCESELKMIKEAYFK